MMTDKRKEMVGDVKRHFRVGSRKSHLAMIQSTLVVKSLEELYPESTFEIVGISTIGDKIQDVALSKIGEKSLFTKELEIALLNKEIDFVVHSLKDLPTTLPNGLIIAAVTKREDARDAVLFSPKVNSSNCKSLKDLPPGSCVGTSSLRRIAQLTYNFPHLKFIDIRGNLNTRLRKLDDSEGPYSALILATAGVKRMGWEDRIGEQLEPSVCMHAVGQGALGIECAQDNEIVIKLLEPLNDPSTYLCCLAERAFLRTLEGGCSVPIGVGSSLDNISKSSSGTTYSTAPTIKLKGSVWSLDGSISILEELERNLNLNESGLVQQHHNLNLTSIQKRNFEFNCDAAENAVQTGISLGLKLIEKGAKAILNEVRAGKTS